MKKFAIFIQVFCAINAILAYVSCENKPIVENNREGRDTILSCQGYKLNAKADTTEHFCWVHYDYDNYDYVVDTVSGDSLKCNKIKYYTMEFSSDFYNQSKETTSKCKITVFIDTSCKVTLIKMSPSDYTNEEDLISNKYGKCSFVEWKYKALSQDNGEHTFFMPQNLDHKVGWLDIISCDTYSPSYDSDHNRKVWMWNNCSIVVDGNEIYYTPYGYKRLTEEANNLEKLKQENIKSKKAQKENSENSQQLNDF